MAAKWILIRFKSSEIPYFFNWPDRRSQRSNCTTYYSILCVNFKSEPFIFALKATFSFGFGNCPGLSAVRDCRLRKDDILKQRQSFLSIRWLSASSYSDSGSLTMETAILAKSIWKVALYDIIDDIISLWYWLWYHMFWFVNDIICLWYHDFISMISYHCNLSYQ
jgi:hypothetical protein